ncbi:MAG: nucleotidyl transferase AbiEii/AbiGii toxin family protein [Chitinivibrionales bacterium]
MNAVSYNHLQLRELFHLEFLRRLALKLKPSQYVLKGGVNMRFFFGSPRYSEDMDLDAQGVGVQVLRDTAMAILTAPSLRETLASFGVESIIAPDISKAKQTETTQRFKIHLTTTADEDLFTKIEFSRRGIAKGVKVETVRAEIMRVLRLPPLMCPHYDAEAAMLQKIEAVAGRSATQARDIFDLYLLITQASPPKKQTGPGKTELLKKAIKNIYSVDFNQFKDTVLLYFPYEERRFYDDIGRWDEIRLIASQCIEELL